MRSDLLVLAPHWGGHFAEFTRWIVSAGVARGHALALAASPDLLASAPDLWDLGAVVHPVGQAGRGGAKPTVRETREMLASAARLAPATRTLHTYLDHALVPLALPSPELVPPHLAGLLFRAPFRVADPFASLARQTARRVLLRRLARGPVRTILTLDQAVVAPLRRLGARADWLPDPAVVDAAPPSAREAVRAEYGVEAGRTLAVLFGSLEERKGVHALAAALLRLDASAAQRLAVLIVGRSADATRPGLLAAIARVDAETKVQIVLRDGFVPDDDLSSLTAAADIILAPYVRHVGSSGVVVRAAAAGVPLLGQDGGQMGREIRQHGLGRTVDPLDTPALARGLAEMIDGGTAFDAARARAYAEAHRVDRFTDKLYDILLPRQAS